MFSTSSSPTNFTLSVPSYAGHFYQLFSTNDLSSAWQSVGSPVEGTGPASSPAALQFSPAFSAPRSFYRIEVTPAP